MFLNEKMVKQLVISGNQKDQNQWTPMINMYVEFYPLIPPSVLCLNPSFNEQSDNTSYIYKTL